MTASNAQNKKLEIGFNGGLGISNLHGPDYNSNYFKTSKLLTPTGGLFLVFGINKNLEIVSSFSFETKGDKFTEVDFTDYAGNSLGSRNISHKFNYTTANVLARGLIGINNEIKIFGNVGPYVGYLINAKEISKLNNPSNANGTYYSDYNRDISGYLKKIDYGITAGIGVMCPLLKKYKLSLEVRRNIGLYGIDNFSSVNNNTSKNNSLDILAGIIFKL